MIGNINMKEIYAYFNSLHEGVERDVRDDEDSPEYDVLYIAWCPTIKGKVMDCYLQVLSVGDFWFEYRVDDKVYSQIRLMPKKNATRKILEFSKQMPDIMPSIGLKLDSESAYDYENTIKFEVIKLLKKLNFSFKKGFEREVDVMDY